MNQEDSRSPYSERLPYIESRDLARGTPDDVTKFPRLVNRRTSSTSSSIPIGKLHRSDEDLQLQEEEVMAEYRDYRMYRRIVNGMHEMKKQTDNSRREADNPSLTNIMRARQSRLVHTDESEHYSIQRPEIYHQPQMYTFEYMAAEQANNTASHWHCESEELMFELEL